ncbi:MAG: AAA family ATPase [Candidatus Omnitrophota bacterium]
MKRYIEKALLEWKNKGNKIPLLVRGARQVGKSYTIETFGTKYFKNIISINFELTPNLKECFQNLKPQDIINKLQLLLNVHITNDCLIFLDEIQECPSAIISLRYFKELMPQQPVIGAGSLLEFSFKQEDFRFPVGRVSFINMEPMSFFEFLDASGYTNLKEHIINHRDILPIDIAIHEKLLDLLRIYLIIGGMPEVVKEYVSSLNFFDCQRIQTGLLETYRNDFGKYANLSHHKYLQKVFDAAPRLTGQRIKFVNIDREVKSRDLRNAIELLSMARVVRPVYASKASGIPLNSQINLQKIKLTFLDIGLMQKACGLQAETQKAKDIMQVNAGAVAEQFVAQELRAYMDPFQDNQLFFWARDKRRSMAEVDYLLTRNKYIIPIEVKAGRSGRLKSLHLFLEQKKSALGIKLSVENISLQDRILSLPLYMVSQIPYIADKLI